MNKVMKNIVSAVVIALGLLTVFGLLIFAASFGDTLSGALISILTIPTMLLFAYVSTRLDSWCESAH
jgi:hypothetical protein